MLSEKRQIPYGFAYAESKQTKTDKLIKRTNRWSPDGRGFEGMGEKGEGIKRYKLPLTKIVTGM